jgi:hypothetical protein
MQDAGCGMRDAGCRMGVAPITPVVMFSLHLFKLFASIDESWHLHALRNRQFTTRVIHPYPYSYHVHHQRRAQSDWMIPSTAVKSDVADYLSQPVTSLANSQLAKFAKLRNQQS